MKNNKFINNNKYIYSNIYSETDQIDKIRDVFLDKQQVKKFLDLFANPSILSGTAQFTYGTTNPTENQNQGPHDKFIAENRWKSPTSYDFDKASIYEWIRGVAGIRKDGYVAKSSLDDDSFHHGDETIRVIRALGGKSELISAPFEAGIKGTEQGFLIFQSEGDNAFVYFPRTISEEQYRGLFEMITPRDGYNFSFTHGEKIFENKSANDVLDYALTIIVLSQGVARL